MKNYLSLLRLTPLLALTACTNSFLPSSSVLNAVNALPSTLPSMAAAATYTIASVQVAATSSSSSSTTPSPSPTTEAAAPPVTILFDPTRSTGLLSDSCTVAAAGQASVKPCACKYEWTEANNTGSTQVNIPHSEMRALTGLQSNLVLCLAPRAWGEIDTGTVVKVSVIPFGTSASAFNVPVYNYTKTATNTQGSFQDAQGVAFSNIHRYGCFQTAAYPKSLGSFVYKRAASDANPPLPLSGAAYAKEVFASAFCVKDASNKTDDSATQDTTATSGAACATITSENSNQAAFFNLYIRATDRGQVNTANTMFTCPKVNESLNGTGLDYWPMDTSFALSVSSSSTFNLGVEAFSKISNPNDPNSVSSSCAAATSLSDQISSGSGGSDSSSSSSSTPDDGSLLKSCIGFAAKPNSDGTCPYFKTPQGTIRPTFRLRRFLALYPPLYTATGRLYPGAQSSDMVYVIDRPVAAAGSDPTKPYAMRGPKPCPFSYYDEKGVLSDPNDSDYIGGMPGYAATNYPGWNGTNVDGIEFPNKDVAGQSCSTALPILNESKSRWGVTTLNRRNPVFKRLFVRPIRSWSPHYMEDTDFQACAPLADPLKDPPLHFSKDPSTGNVGWCAESYPTQNTNITKLDRLKANSVYPGRVLPFTSHVVKNASGSACQANPVSVSSLGTAYPPNPTAPSSSTCTQAGQVFYGTAYHPNNYIVDVASAIGGVCNNSSVLDVTSCNFCAHQTCDRTVATATLAWSHFPLLARPAQVESAMAADSTYGCVVTYDNGGGKAGKTTPTEGCCGSAVRVWTGFDTSGTPNPNKANTSAHLEPTQQCLVPNY